MTYTTFMEQNALLTDQEFAAMLEAEGFAVPEGLFADLAEDGSQTGTQAAQDAAKDPEFWAQTSACFVRGFLTGLLG